MSVDYDLVVIGGETVGRHAALAAARMEARVALVVEPHLLNQNSLETSYTYLKALNQVGRFTQQLNNAAQFGIHWRNVNAPQSQSLATVELTEAMQWARGVASIHAEQNSLPVLASLGIDVIVDKGEFCRQPQLAFGVKERQLTARSYLIATGSRPEVPDIEGLKLTGYLTPANIWQQISSPKLPSKWVIIGGTPVGIELSQTLLRLGAEVTLIVSDSHILHKEDSEAALLIQAQLEAEGVCVLTQTDVTQVKKIDDKKWVLAGNKAIEADEIVLAVNQQPNIESLNLEGVGVKFHPQGIYLNEKLQTTNSRIYACGDVIGGYQFPHIAEYEANIALKNALFSPIFKVDYKSIPWAIFTNPTLARVGLTETQAKNRYGNKVLVLRQYFKGIPQAQILDETTGFCKIIVLDNGEILGATIVGSEAEELIGAIALAIRQKLKISAIADFPPISATLSEITYKTAAEWNKQRLNSNTSLKNFLESLFNWRRSRFKP